MFYIIDNILFNDRFIWNKKLGKHINNKKALQTVKLEGFI